MGKNIKSKSTSSVMLRISGNVLSKSTIWVESINFYGGNTKKKIKTKSVNI